MHDMIYDNYLLLMADPDKTTNNLHFHCDGNFSGDVKDMLY